MISKQQLTCKFFVHRPQKQSRPLTQQNINRPPYESSLFLVLYDLITANPHFVAIMLHQSAREEKTGPTFLGSFISYASYLFQHNRNPRAFLYTRLLLTIFLSIVENQSIMNYMAKDQNAEFVRICRQVE